MKQYADLRRWFLSLEQRERRVLTGGGILLLIVIVYGGVLAPFAHSKTALSTHVAEQRALLAWMQPAAARIHALGGTQPAALPANSLLATINSEASSIGLGNTLRQVQQQNDGSVRVQLEGAAFDTVLHWLDNLHQRHGIVVSDMSVQRSGGAGLVNATLSLKVPAA
ncbi:MAG TPA: type II secretion system protein M [Gammaproteobacteria bacterium]|nr:type II secretion system protein M [Gammaproteobacteria bacterium]